MMENLITYLQGKKTYFVVGIGIAMLILRNPMGVDIPDVPADPDWVLHVMGLLGLSTARAAIGKVE